MPTLNPTHGEATETGPREVVPFQKFDGPANQAVTDFGPTVQRVTDAHDRTTTPPVVAEADEPNEPATPAPEGESGDDTPVEVPDGETVIEQSEEPETDDPEGTISE